LKQATPSAPESWAVCPQRTGRTAVVSVDIDNEEDGPILRIKDARAICHDNGLPLAFYYQTSVTQKNTPNFGWPL
jgi:hypothetical protein